MHLLVEMPFWTAERRLTHYDDVDRTIELAQGWEGYLITHEVFFFVLDSIPMVFSTSPPLSSDSH